SVANLGHRSRATNDCRAARPSDVSARPSVVRRPKWGQAASAWKSASSNGGSKGCPKRLRAERCPRWRQPARVLQPRRELNHSPTSAADETSRKSVGAWQTKLVGLSAKKFRTTRDPHPQPLSRKRKQQAVMGRRRSALGGQGLQVLGHVALAPAE